MTPAERGAAAGPVSLSLRWDGGAADIALLPAGDAEARFLAAVVGWTLLLDGEDLGAWGFAEAAALATASVGPEPSGAGAEVVDLMRRSAGLP